MNLLSRFKFHAKLALLLGMSALAIVVSIGAAASIMRQRMVQDRIDKVQSIVIAAKGFAQSLQDKVDAQQMTHQQALAMFREEIHRVRFGANDDYLLVQDLDGMVLMHGGDPKREGRPTASEDASGRSTADLIRDRLRTADGGVIWYTARKPGHAEPQAKVSYVSEFAPWQMVFIAGAWIDDMDSAFRASLVSLGSIGGGILAATLLVAWLINRDITRSLASLNTAMGRLAGGATADEIPERDRGDEIGAMAACVQVFKDNMIETARLRAEQETQKQTAEQARRQGMLDLAAKFEANVGGVVENVAAAATELQSTAQGMAATSERASQQATSVAAASEQATHNVQTVASATEELSASIREITHQVTQANVMIRASADQASQSNEQVRGLTAVADRIGDVVGIIRNIADQTNLLALNATIEAARAGDAGKGFAVVASEVKALANQTAKATEEIAAQIKTIQDATQTSARLIGGIAGSIEQVNETAAAIAAAVEEQGAATQEISRNVLQAAEGTQEVSGKIAGVSQAAQHTGVAAGHVLTSAGALLRNGEALKAQVAGFLREVRAA